MADEQEEYQPLVLDDGTHSDDEELGGENPCSEEGPCSSDDTTIGGTSSGSTLRVFLFSSLGCGFVFLIGCLLLRRFTTTYQITLSIQNINHTSYLAPVSVPEETGVVNENPAEESPSKQGGTAVVLEEHHAAEESFPTVHEVGKEAVIDAKDAVDDKVSYQQQEETRSRPSALYTMDSEQAESFRYATTTTTKDMEEIEPPRGYDKLCDYVEGLHGKPSDPILLLNFTQTSCFRDFGRMGGTGNKLGSIFDMRLAALAARRTALIQDCGNDAIEASQDLVRPWLSGYFPAARGLSELPLGMAMPSKYCPPPIEEGDDDNRELGGPTGYAIPLMRHDLRRMAVALVGVPEQDHPSAAFEMEFLLPEAQNPPYTPSAATGAIYRVPIHNFYQNGPVFPDAKMDDAVIHFRCGDILLGAHGYHHYVKFAEYAKRISPAVRTIGIVTQPFSKEGNVQSRPGDNVEKSGERCKLLVYGLVEYLQSHFPTAEISIHNGPHETVALAYARMIMANQTLSLIASTFSVYPTLATFGTGYFPIPVGRERRVGYRFVNDDLTKHLYGDVLELLAFQKRLSSEKLTQLFDEEKGNAALEWFRNETLDFDY